MEEEREKMRQEIRDKVRDKLLLFFRTSIPVFEFIRRRRARGSAEIKFENYTWEQVGRVNFIYEFEKGSFSSLLSLFLSSFRIEFERLLKITPSFRVFGLPRSWIILGLFARG